MDLFGARVLLTGASGGLGGHIARRLATEGATLVLSGRATGPLERLAAELPGALVVPADLADAREAAALFDRAEAAAGPVDVLVNNAGLELAVRFDEMRDGDIERMVAVNLTATMLLTRRALERMRARGRGHVVAMSSIAGRGGTAYDAAYAATKAGMVGLTRSLRCELAGTPVGASVICPGFVSDDGIYPRMQAVAGDAPVLLRPVPPRRVADAVVSAIRHDRPEVMVAAVPLRPLTALQELAPRLAERVTLATGARRYLREVAQAGAGALGRDRVAGRSSSNAAPMPPESTSRSGTATRSASSPNTSPPA